MPTSDTYSPQFPNVPALPGVPPLARMATPAAVAAAATTAGQSDALATQLGLPAGSVFGSTALYAGLNLQPLDPSYQILGPDGTQIIQADSAVELDFGADSSVNTHPVEQGGFAAYNRVQQPISIRLLLACQGSKYMERWQFLSALADLRESTTVVSVAVPDATYPNMVLKSYSYRKTAENGAVTIWADTQWVEERSDNVTVSPAPTSQPQGAPSSNLGSVTPAAPTASQQASISNPPVSPAALPAAVSDGMPPSGDAG